MQTEIESLDIDVNYRYSPGKDAAQFEQVLARMVSETVQEMAASLTQSLVMAKTGKAQALNTQIEHIDIEHIEIDLPKVNISAFLSRPKHYFATQIKPAIQRQMEGKVLTELMASDAVNSPQLKAAISRLTTSVADPASGVKPWRENALEEHFVPAMLSNSTLFKRFAERVKAHIYDPDTAYVLSSAVPSVMVKSLMVASKEADEYGEKVWHFAERLLAKQGQGFDDVVWQRIMALVLRLKQSAVSVTANEWHILVEAFTGKATSMFHEQLSHWSLSVSQGGGAQGALSFSSGQGLSQKAVDDLIGLAHKELHGQKIEWKTAQAHLFSSSSSASSLSSFSPFPSASHEKETHAVNQNALWIKTLKHQLGVMRQLKQALQSDTFVNLDTLYQHLATLISSGVTLDNHTLQRISLSGLNTQNTWQATALAMSRIEALSASAQNRENIPWDTLRETLRLTSLSTPSLRAIAELLSLQKSSVQSYKSTVQNQNNDAFWAEVKQRAEAALAVLKKAYVAQDSLLSPRSDSDFWLPLKRALSAYAKGIEHQSSVAYSDAFEEAKWQSQQARLACDLSDSLLSCFHHFPSRTREHLILWLQQPNSASAFDAVWQALNGLGLANHSEPSHTASGLTERDAKAALTRMQVRLNACFSFASDGSCTYRGQSNSSLTSAAMMQELVAYSGLVNQLSQASYGASWFDNNALNRLNIKAYSQQLRHCVKAFYADLPLLTQQQLSLQTWHWQLGSAFGPTQESPNKAAKWDKQGVDGTSGSHALNEMGRDRIFAQRWQALKAQVSYLQTQIQRFGKPSANATPDAKRRVSTTNNQGADSKLTGKAEQRIEDQKDAALGLKANRVLTLFQSCCEEALFVAKTLQFQKQNGANLHDGVIHQNADEAMSWKQMKVFCLHPALKQVRAWLDGVNDGGNRKDDIENGGAVKRHVMSVIDQIMQEDASAVPSSKELRLLQTLVAQIQRLSSVKMAFSASQDASVQAGADHSENGLNQGFTNISNAPSDDSQQSHAALKAAVLKIKQHTKQLNADAQKPGFEPLHIRALLALGLNAQALIRSVMEWEGHRTSVKNRDDTVREAFVLLSTVVSQWLTQAELASKQDKFGASHSDASLKQLQNIHVLLVDIERMKGATNTQAYRSKLVSLARVLDVFTHGIVQHQPWQALACVSEKYPAVLPKPLQDSAVIDAAKQGAVEAFNALDLPAMIAPAQQQLQQALNAVADETNHVPDVGLALFWPFLSTLFMRLGLLNESKQWVGCDGEDPVMDAQSSGEITAAQEKARGLLMYLYCQNENGPEQPEEDAAFVPVCANLLVGLPAMTALSSDIVLSSDEKAECERLQANLIQQWQALKEMSATSFNTMFVQRVGQLEKVDFGFAIEVEKQAQDILLAKLPWGLGIIRLPWLNTVMLDIRWQSGL